MKYFGLFLSFFVACAAMAKSPSEIIAHAKANEWRTVDINNTLYLQLDTGLVVVELAPRFAPKHVQNTKALVKEGVFDNSNFYRVIDGFVAQGGPLEKDDKKIKTPKIGQLTIAAEFTLKTPTPLAITTINQVDGYAAQTGFIDGFAIGRSHDKQENWLLHCYGAFGMGRANDPNTGGTELYIVIGNAQRYLDRNTTVFGRVLLGMEHIQALKRSQNIQGTVDLTGKNKIISIKLGSEVSKDVFIPLEALKTDSQSFKALIESRKNRRNKWFVYQHNYIDACSVPLPVRIKKH